jgi:hypothetical protein
MEAYLHHLDFYGREKDMILLVGSVPLAVLFIP